MSTVPFPVSRPERPHNRAVWSDARCAQRFRPFYVDSPPKGSLTARPPRFPLNAADTTRCTLTVMRERKHSSMKARSSPNTRTDQRTRDLKRLTGKREELIGTVYELYGRANEVALRLQDDVRTLVDLHRETTGLLYVLRSLPSERSPAQVPTPAAAAPARRAMRQRAERDGR